MESGNGGRGRIRREWLKVEEAGNTEKATGEPTAEEEAEQVTYEVDRGGGDHEHAGEASQAEDRPRARRVCTQSRQLCSKTPMLMHCHTDKNACITWTIFPDPNLNIF